MARLRGECLDSLGFLPVPGQEALTTRMLTEYANDPGIGRAEALRRSMMALMMDHEDPRFAHPFYWAPFVIVGEGGVPADRAINVQ